MESPRWRTRSSGHPPKDDGFGYGACGHTSQNALAGYAEAAMAGAKAGYDSSFTGFNVSKELGRNLKMLEEAAPDRVEAALNLKPARSLGVHDEEGWRAAAMPTGMYNFPSGESPIGVTSSGLPTQTLDSEAAADWATDFVREWQPPGPLVLPSASIAHAVNATTAGAEVAASAQPQPEYALLQTTDLLEPVKKRGRGRPRTNERSRFKPAAAAAIDTSYQTIQELEMRADNIRNHVRAQQAVILELQSTVLQHPTTLSTTAISEKLLSVESPRGAIKRDPSLIKGEPPSLPSTYEAGLSPVVGNQANPPTMVAMAASRGAPKALGKAAPAATAAIRKPKGSAPSRQSSFSDSDSTKQRKTQTPINNLAKFFHLTIKEASRETGICQTVLKKICRANGIKRWPSRRVNAMNRQMNNLREALATAETTGVAAACNNAQSSSDQLKANMVKENTRYVLNVLSTEYEDTMFLGRREGDEEAVDLQLHRGGDDDDGHDNELGGDVEE